MCHIKNASYDNAKVTGFVALLAYQKGSCLLMNCLFVYAQKNNHCYAIIYAMIIKQWKYNNCRHVVHIAINIENSSYEFPLRTC